MSATTNNINLELTKYRKRIAYSFLRAGRFDPYMGDGPTSIIQRVKDLAGDGKQINIPLVDQLRSDGTATGQLTGQEEAVDNYGMPMWADWARNAVAFTKSSKKESAINIRDTASPLLSGWTKRKRRDDMIAALVSIPTAAIMSGYHQGSGNRVNGLKWKDANATQRNNWLTANSDRVRFGALLSNTVAGNVASSLSNITTTDKMTAAVGSFLKRTAMATTALENWPAINPYSVEDDGDQEWYVCFLGSRAFRDLKADPVMYQANRDARERESGPPEKMNPIFTGSHLVYDGVIYREIPEMDAYYIGAAANPGPFYGVSAGGKDVAPVVLCGASAYAYVIGQMPRPTKRDETDYQFVEGIGIEMQYGFGKIAKDATANAGSVGALKDWGVVTGFVYALPDA